MLLRSSTVTNINTNTYFRYLRLGLSLRPIRGICDALEDLDFAYATYCEGVQYVLNDFGEFEETFDSTDMMNCIENLDSIANSSRHDYVVQVKNYIESKLKKPVWCMVGTEPQLGVAFGTENGYVAQLIMDFTSEEKFQEYKAKILQSLVQMGIPEDKMPDIQDIEEFVLISSSEEYDVLFNNLNIPGIIVEHFDDDDNIDIDLDDEDD